MPLFRDVQIVVNHGKRPGWGREAVEGVIVSVPLASLSPDENAELANAARGLLPEAEVWLSTDWVWAWATETYNPEARRICEGSGVAAVKDLLQQRQALRPTATANRAAAVVRANARYLQAQRDWLALPDDRIIRRRCLAAISRPQHATAGLLPEVRERAARLLAIATQERDRAA